jgi:hypothetical protein
MAVYATAQFTVQLPLSRSVTLDQVVLVGGNGTTTIGSFSIVKNNEVLSSASTGDADYGAPKSLGMYAFSFEPIKTIRSANILSAVLSFPQATITCGDDSVLPCLNLYLTNLNPGTWSDSDAKTITTIFNNPDVVPSLPNYQLSPGDSVKSIDITDNIQKLVAIGASEYGFRSLAIPGGSFSVPSNRAGANAPVITIKYSISSLRSSASSQAVTMLAILVPLLMLLAW